MPLLQIKDGGGGVKDAQWLETSQESVVKGCVTRDVHVGDPGGRWRTPLLPVELPEGLGLSVLTHCSRLMAVEATALELRHTLYMTHCVQLSNTGVVDVYREGLPA